MVWFGKRLDLASGGSGSGQRLEFSQVHKWYALANGRSTHALRGVTFHIEPGQVVALVGESGSGKTTLARIAVGLEEPDQGEVRYGDRPLAAIAGAELRAYRRHVKMLFQDPSLGVGRGKTVAQAFTKNLPETLKGKSLAERGERIRETIRRVGFERPTEVLAMAPETVPPAEKQRIALARAILGGADLLVADEPFSLLDGRARSDLLHLLRSLHESEGMGYLYITHDLESVRALADRIVVMHAGAVVEEGPADQVLQDPYHPYTQRLLAAVDDLLAEPAGDALWSGDAGAADREVGCAFRGRCPYVEDVCRTAAPALLASGEGRRVACHLYAR